MDLEITKEAFDALADDKKTLYEEKDGKYQVTRDVLLKELSTLPGLKANHDKLLSEVKDAKNKLSKHDEAIATAKKAADEAELAAQVKAGEVDAIRKSKDDAVNAARQESSAKIADLEARLNRRVVESDVISIAGALAVKGSEGLLADSIRRRIRARYTEDDVVPEYLDKDGSPTVYTRDEFMKSIASDPSYARILKGSEASGGGHQGSAATSTTNAAQGGAGAQGSTTREDMAKRYQEQINKLNK